MDADAGLTAIDTRFGGAPVPVSDTVCGLLLAPSLKLIVPVRVPVACGEKDTDAVQLPPAASVLGLIGQVEVTVKSLELLVIEVIFSEVDWLLVNVTF